MLAESVDELVEGLILFCAGAGEFIMFWVCELFDVGLCAIAEATPNTAMGTNRNMERMGRPPSNAPPQRI